MRASAASMGGRLILHDGTLAGVLVVGMQGDDLKLFELGEVVTWPVGLVDAEAEGGWPKGGRVETTVTLLPGPGAERNLLRSAPKVSACWQGGRELGSVPSVPAGWLPTS